MPLVLGFEIPFKPCRKVHVIILFICLLFVTSLFVAVAAAVFYVVEIDS